MKSNVDATSKLGGQVSPRIQMYADSEESDGCHITINPIRDALIQWPWKYSHHH